MKAKVERFATVLEQIIAGLNKFDLVAKMQKDPSTWKLLLCNSNTFVWDYDLFIDALIVNWSEEGSNRKRDELKVYRSFIEMCEISFHAGRLYFFLINFKFSSGSRIAQKMEKNNGNSKYH